MASHFFPFLTQPEDSDSCGEEDSSAQLRPRMGKGGMRTKGVLMKDPAILPPVNSDCTTIRIAQITLISWGWWHFLAQRTKQTISATGMKHSFKNIQFFNFYFYQYFYSKKNCILLKTTGIFSWEIIIRTSPKKLMSPEWTQYEATSQWGQTGPHTADTQSTWSPWIKLTYLLQNTTSGRVVFLGLPLWLWIWEQRWGREWKHEAVKMKGSWGLPEDLAERKSTRIPLYGNSEANQQCSQVSYNQHGQLALSVYSMPGVFLWMLCLYEWRLYQLLYSSWPLYEAGCTITLILLMKKVRHRDLAHLPKITH